MYTAVKPLSKYLRVKSVHIYDGIFTLHSKCTVVLLLTCSFLLSAKQYFGEPIRCEGELQNAEYVNSYCWTMGTYILNYYDIINNKSAPESARKIASKAIAEGVGNDKIGVTERIYLRYYQWVIMVLLLQSAVFLFPSFLWKIWEGERLRNLVAGVDSVLISDEAFRARRKLLCLYFSSDYKAVHNCYLAKYMFCELLNLLISISNIFLLNKLFDGFWFKYFYAIKAMRLNQWDEWNHMSSRVFPKVAKCSLRTYGPGGSANTYDIICLLPLNILNEKVFAFLWCWFLLIAILAAFKVLYRIMLLCIPQLRLLLLRSRIPFTPKKHLQTILTPISIGDWFVLLKVAVNINPVLLNDLIQTLYRHHERSTLNVDAA